MPSLITLALFSQDARLTSKQPMLLAKLFLHSVQLTEQDVFPPPHALPIRLKCFVQVFDILKQFQPTQHHQEPKYVHGLPQEHQEPAQIKAVQMHQPP